MDGLQLLTLIRRQNAQVPVVVMTAYGSIETAVESMKAGATDFCSSRSRSITSCRWSPRRSKCGRCATKTGS